MQQKTLLFNGVSGSGKSTIIKTLCNSNYRNELSTISPKSYLNGTTSTNAKYTFGNFTNISIAKVTVNDFETEWEEFKYQKEKECTDNNSNFNEQVEKINFFNKVKTSFINGKFITNLSIDFDNANSRKNLENAVKAMKLVDVITLINKNKIDNFIHDIKINIPYSSELSNVLKKHKLAELSIIDTKGIGQDDEARHLDFPSIDGMIFISDGSKLTDKYQKEIKEDFKNCLKSTPILVALRHAFDLPFENLAGFNNSLLTTSTVDKYIECLDKYCSNESNKVFVEIKQILKKCGLQNDGFLKKVVNRYAFNALPQDYSKDDSMPEEYALKTEAFYEAAVVHMIDKCLQAVDDYFVAYNQANNFLTTKTSLLDSLCKDIDNFGHVLFDQMMTENRLNARVLRAYPDQLGVYGWLPYALNNDPYDKKRLRITLFNAVTFAIDYSLDKLVENTVITQDVADILSVFFYKEIKNNSTWLNMGYDWIGFDMHITSEAINYLISSADKEHGRFKWFYTSLEYLGEYNDIYASTFWALYLGSLDALNLKSFNSNTLVQAMISSK